MVKSEVKKSEIGDKIYKEVKTENKFGLAEFEALAAEMHKIKKGDVRTIKLILKVVQIPYRLIEEAREKMSASRRKVSGLNVRIEQLDKDMESASTQVEAEEQQIKHLEKVVERFA